MNPNPLDPKGSEGAKKPQLQLVPPALMDETAKAIQHGAEKYGPWNWRKTKVEMMTYIGAMKRHIDALLEGEDIDDSGAHHLGCVAASCAIVLDARKHGTLVDNRPGAEVKPGGCVHGTDGKICRRCYEMFASQERIKTTLAYPQHPGETPVPSQMCPQCKAALLFRNDTGTTLCLKCGFDPSAQHTTRVECTKCGNIHPRNPQSLICTKCGNIHPRNPQSLICPKCWAKT
jgi:hypothetical protein